MKNLFLFLISLAGFVHSSHTEIKSMTELGSFIDADTLVIFDLDNTIFQAKRYDCHADWYYDKIESEKKIGAVSLETKQRVYAEWEKSQSSCPVEFVEIETASEIEQLRMQNRKVMALTSRGPDISGSTLEQLSSLGLSFEQTALSSSSVGFKSNSGAEFIKGVLFVSPFNSKGSVLQAYFETIKYQPKRIVFVDDLMENLESLENAFPSIDFIGLYYPLVKVRLARYSEANGEM